MSFKHGRERRLMAMLALALLVSKAAGYLSIPFNSTYYFGPDGPWQGIVFDVKYDNPVSIKQTVSFLPAWWPSGKGPSAYIPSDRSCDNFTESGCGVGGTIPPSPVDTNTDFHWNSFDIYGGDWFFNCTGNWSTAELVLSPSLLLWDPEVIVSSNLWITYPSGITTGFETGLLGLGGSPRYWKDNPPEYVYRKGFVSSNSFGMHIGAANLDYPGSLVFGGYDKGRVLGPVVTFNAKEWALVQLLDVIIGVELGESPFNFTRHTGLLASGDQTQTFQAQVSPQSPYIALPQHAIDAIVSKLPVIFNSRAGYYLWDTDDPDYKTIVTSSAYLGFVFADDIIIKVPFMLLNLTLESSITGFDSNVPYLPILNSGSSSKWLSLGRAFFQAAFVGVNWENYVGWIAQAPGPGKDKDGLGSDIRDLAFDASTLEPSGSSDSLFQTSWADYWTVIKTASNGSVEPPPESSKTGLGGGVIAGIVIGAVAVVAILAMIFFIVMRRRKQSGKATQANAVGEDVQSPAMSPSVASELDHDTRRWSELEAKSRSVEGGAWNVERHELSGKHD